MTRSRDEAVGLLENWQSASTILSLMLLGAGVALNASSRVKEISPFSVAVSLGDGEGVLTVIFNEVSVFELPSSPQCAAALVFRLSSGVSVGLFESLPEQDFFLDGIPPS